MNVNHRQAGEVPAGSCQLPAMATGSRQPTGNRQLAAFQSQRSLPQIIRRRPLLVVGGVLLCVSLAAAYVMTGQPTSTATAKICVQPGSQVIAESQNQPVNLYTYLRTQCAVIKTTPVLKSAMATLQPDQMSIFDGVRDPVEYLMRALKVEAGQGDLVLTLTLESRQPDQAIEIVNAVAHAYVTWMAQQRNNTTSALVAAIEAEKKLCGAQVDQKTRAMAQFRAANRAPTFDSERVKSVINKLSNLEDQLLQARMERMFEFPLPFSDTPKSGTAQTAANWPLAVANSENELINLRASLEEQRMRLATLSQKYSEQHPTVQLAQTTIEQTEARIRACETRLAETTVAAARVRQEQAKRRETQLEDAIAAQEKALAELQGKTDEYARLEADLMRTAKLYDSLDMRAKELGVNRDAGAVQASVLEWGNVLIRATWPRNLQYLAAALALGLALGCAAAAVRDRTDRRFRSTDDVVAQLGLPVVGVVPAVSGWYRRNGHTEIENPTAAEAYAIARTSIELSGQRAQSLLVTSAARGEGRTAVAVNLASSLAESNQRVLLIDANFRNSAIHTVFGVGNDAGLSAVLSANEPVDGLIVPTGVHGLDVLPAGPAPSRPSAALCGRMAEVLRELSRHYDRIVVDGPPVQGLADAQVLASMADATVFVIRANATSRVQAALAVEALEGAGSRMIGAIVHGAPRQNAEEAAAGWCCRTAGTSGYNPANEENRLSLSGQQPASAAA